MPFILLGLAVIAAFLYGLVRLYQTVSATFGELAGSIVDLAIVLTLVALGIAWLRRYRSIHGRRVKGERVLTLAGEWGTLKVDAERKNSVLEMHGQREVMIFADIDAARPEARQGRWFVVVASRLHRQGGWSIPMPDRNQADRWVKIFRLAAQQKL